MIFRPLEMDAKCPHGYRYHSGDKISDSERIVVEEVQGIEDCGVLCHRNEECKSMEWSEEDKECQLFSSEFPDGPKYRHVVFCSKLNGYQK